jgi:hypothetical protein
VQGAPYLEAARQLLEQLVQQAAWRDSSIWPLPPSGCSLRTLPLTDGPPTPASCPLAAAQAADRGVQVEGIMQLAREVAGRGRGAAAGVQPPSDAAPSAGGGAEGSSC